MWRHRGLVPADVMLASYPRSGNTWTKFMLAELLTGSETDFCSEDEVVPFVGRHLRAKRLLPGGGRLVKTHEPYCKTYDQHRAIYLVRDVRDVALSFQKLRTAEGFADENFEEFLVRFVQGNVAGFGSWQAHVHSWLAAAEHGSDILIVHYEALIDDTILQLGDMARFLGISADDKRLREIAENNRPAKMRERKTPYSAKLMSMAVGDGTYNRWEKYYSESELALVEPSMEAMFQAGYTLKDAKTTELGVMGH